MLLAGRQSIVEDDARSRREILRYRERARAASYICNNHSPFKANVSFAWTRHARAANCDRGCAWLQRRAATTPIINARSRARATTYFPAFFFVSSYPISLGGALPVHSRCRCNLQRGRVMYHLAALKLPERVCARVWKRIAERVAAAAHCTTQLHFSAV